MRWCNADAYGDGFANGNADTHGDANGNCHVYPNSNSDSNSDGDAHTDGNANGNCHVYPNGNSNSDGYGYSYTDGNAYVHTDANGNGYVHADRYSDGDCHSYAHTDAYGYSDSNSYGNSDLNADSNCSEAFADTEAASNDTATASVVRIGKWNSSGGNSRETSRVLRLSVDRPAGAGRAGGVAAGRSMTRRRRCIRRIEPVLGAGATYGCHTTTRCTSCIGPLKTTGWIAALCKAIAKQRELAFPFWQILKNENSLKFCKKILTPLVTFS